MKVLSKNGKPLLIDGKMIPVEEIINIKDVKLNGTSLVGTDGIVNIPSQITHEEYETIVQKSEEVSTKHSETLTAKTEAVSARNDAVSAKESAQSLVSGASATINGKLDKPTDSPVVGKVLKVKSVNADGTFVCEWADDASGSVDDVKVNGTSVVTDGVANIPIVDATEKFGLVKLESGFGLGVNANKKLQILKASESNISNRNSNYAYQPIVPSNLDYAVKAALTDGKGQAYTDEQKAAACERLGAVYDGKYELIEEVTIAEDSTIVTFDFQNRYKKIRLTIDTKGLLTETQYYSVTPNYTNGQYLDPNCIFRSEYNYSNTNGKLIEVYIIEVKNGNLTLENYYGNNNDKKNPNRSSVYTSTQELSADYINSIAIASYNANKIKTGYSIKIEGVKA